MNMKILVRALLSATLTVPWPAIEHAAWLDRIEGVNISIVTVLRGADTVYVAPLLFAQGDRSTSWVLSVPEGQKGCFGLISDRPRYWRVGARLHNRLVMEGHATSRPLSETTNRRRNGTRVQHSQAILNFRVARDMLESPRLLLASIRYCSA